MSVFFKRFLFFFSEIDTVKKLKQEAKQKMKREKTAVTGDLRPLIDALPSVSTTNDEKSQFANFKKRDKQMKLRKSTLPQKQRKKH